ncbi:MAG: hypothetical protein ABL914_07595 [Novosphingobium sp.]|uniref:hypothetical protein n=1 Tax=Novosphingobium sp. TaxID=1874826 RepID=UPI0032BC832B
MRKVFLLAALAALTAPSGGVLTPGADKLLDALERHDRQAAIHRVLAIESISGRPQPVATPAEFVDRIIDCKITQRQKRTAYNPHMQVDWQCPDGKYRALLFEDKNGPFVVVAEFWDPKRMAAEFDENGNRRPLGVVPPMPIGSLQPRSLPQPPSAADRKVVDGFGQALFGGTLGGLSAQVSPTVKVTLGRRDMVHNVTRVEEVGEGAEALARILPIARGKVAGTLVLTCKTEEQSGSCALKDQPTTQVLVASITLRDGLIQRVDFLYVNPQTLREDAAD